MDSGERERALALLRLHGWNTTSFQVLEPGFRYWFDAAGEAFVAYVDTGRAWVTGGPPVAAAARMAAVTAEFLAEARKASRRACFFAVEERFAQAVGWPTLQIGEQPVWDPRRWPEVLAGSRSLRQHLSRARAKGSAVRRLAPEEVADPEAPSRRAVQALIAEWLAGRRMAPMGFLVEVEPFSFAGERLLFVAEQDGRVTGFLAAVPVYARRGWLFEDLLRAPGAANGTAELLVDAGMRAAAAAGAARVTLGLAPLAGDVPQGLRWARELGRALYDFGGLRAFKARLRPEAWEPVFLCAGPRDSRLIALTDSLAAFARGNLGRFALQTLARGHVPVILVLTVLVAGWIPLLAAAEPTRWFPSAAVKWAWVGFDLVLGGLLVALARRYRGWLAASLALLLAADAALTTAQVVAFNLPRLRGPLELAVLVLSCLGPALAALAVARLAHRGRQLRP